MIFPRDSGRVCLLSRENCATKVNLRSSAHYELCEARRAEKAEGRVENQNMKDELANPVSSVNALPSAPSVPRDAACPLPPPLEKDKKIPLHPPFLQKGEANRETSPPRAIA